jgi:hypothetical protein
MCEALGWIPAPKTKRQKKKKNPFIQELELVIFEYYSRPAGRFGEKNDIE